jgi:hypothetical protein
VVNESGPSLGLYLKQSCWTVSHRNLSQENEMNIMDQEFEEWLENDWFTSGETSWEEYYNGELDEAQVAQENL